MLNRCGGCHYILLVSDQRKRTELAVPRYVNGSAPVGNRGPVIERISGLMGG